MAGVVSTWYILCLVHTAQHKNIFNVIETLQRNDERQSACRRGVTETRQLVIMHDVDKRQLKSLITCYPVFLVNNCPIGRVFGKEPGDSSSPALGIISYFTTFKRIEDNSNVRETSCQKLGILQSSIFRGLHLQTHDDTDFHPSL